MAEVGLVRMMAVDDHPLMMAGIAGEINAQPDMRVVAEATDGDEALALFRIHRPDVTLMDIRMPNDDVFTVKNGKLASAYHVENWMTALQQING
jgi:DNA-binding NarL/FixJ family response regulator